VAPFCPFVAEEMYGTLVAAHDPEAPESVHLAAWPAPRGRRDPGLEDAMAVARAAVGAGLRARSEARLKVRQPLAEAVVAGPVAMTRAVEGLADLVAEELNVRRVRLVTDPAELVEVTVKPNYRRLGPRFGRRMPEVAAAVAALPAAESARAIDAGQEVEIALDGGRERLASEDLLLEVRPTEGYAVGQEAALAVGLATEITPDLRREALAREVVHAVQGARRAAGLRVEERIRLHLDGSGELREAVEEHRDAIAAETLAARLTVGHGAPFAGLRREEHVVDGEPLALRLERV
jgi:isoleucyl-tRNA synthetase